MADSEYVLTYFNAKGRAEETRLLFAVAGHKYEDVRIVREDWPEIIKPKTPFGQLPTLDVDGITLTQSSAIARFVAKRFGLAGKNDVDSALIDSYVAQMGDVMAQVRIYIFAKDAAKEEAKEAICKELKRVLSEFNVILASSEYLVGGELSWADINVMSWLDLFSGLQLPVQLDDYPNVKAHYERVRSTPSIKNWLETRPVTER